MRFDHDRPEGANLSDPSFLPRAVRWEDPEDVRRWLTALSEGISDLISAARDRSRGKRHRVLSRHEARRQVGASGRSLGVLLRAGEAGLAVPPAPCEPTPEAEEGPPEAEPPFSSRRPISTPPDPAS